MIPPRAKNSSGEPGTVRLGCCASLGTPYGYGGFATCLDRAVGHPEAWTDNELHAMVRRIAACGFREVIPWTDYPPGVIRGCGPGDETRSVANTKQPFLNRVKRFVEIAPADGLRVHLYFAVGTGVMASVRVHENGEKRIHVNELGVTHPQYATRDRRGRSSLDLVLDGEAGLAFAGLGYPEVRCWIADYVVDTVVSSGADGVQLEPLSVPLDDKGTCVYGYDEPVIAGFRDRYGRDPLTLPNSDEAWVSHRCGFTTQMVREVRQRIARLDKPVELSVQCHDLATDNARYLWPWRDWVEERLVDACYLKSTSAQGLHERLRVGREWCDGHGVRFAGILDMKTYSRFRTPESVAEGVRVILASGTPQVTIYGLAFTPLAPNPKEAPIERWQAARELLRGAL